MELTLPDLRAGYVRVANLVARDGARVGPRGLATRELTGVTLNLPARAPLLPAGVGRGVSRKLAAVEALQLVGGVSRHDLVRRAAPGFDGVLVDPEHAAYGAYGPRLREQVTAAVHLLRDDPDTRRAVLAIWRPDDLTHDGDRPCTVFLQLLLRWNQLELHSSMRSQDVWLGLAYDLWSFGQLRDTVARQLNVAPGRLVHHVGSLHVYETDLDRIGKLGTTPYDVPPTLPTGVASSGIHHGLAGVARALLDGTASPVAVEMNPWYVQQLALIGVVQGEGATT